jgi:Ca2+-binding RTX toxin-like protein
MLPLHSRAFSRAKREKAVTTTIINTSTSSGGDVITLTGSNNVLVLDTVDLVSTAATGIKYAATVTGGTTTMNGFVYGDIAGIEMLAGGTNEILDIYGKVQSAATGIHMGAGGAHLYVADGASVTGGSTGVDITGGTVYVENHGTIASDNFSAGYGIEVGNVVVSQILNYGYIGGVQAQSDNMLLVNFGIIEGVGTTSANTSTVNVVRNYGMINDYISLHRGDQLLNAGQVQGSVTLTGNFIKNTGLINGDVSDSTANSDIMINKGTITGDLTLSNGLNSYEGHNGHVLGTITGGDGADTIRAGSDDDTINGGNGVDLLDGGAGDDLVSGGGKGDSITGGKGDDALTGGGGADTFNFSGHFGDDVITDFIAGSASGHDVIHFATNDFADFADVQSHMTQVGADVLITHGEDTILIQNVTTASLVSADFLFG